MKIKLQLLLLLLSCSCFSLSAHAAKVAKAKGKKLLITLEGDPAQSGDIYYTLGPNGKRAGIIKIMKIKGDQALAILGKGRATPGMGLEFRPPTNKQAKTPPPSTSSDTDPLSGDEASVEMSATESSSEAAPDGKMYWGFMGGFSMNSMDVELRDGSGTSRGTASLSGSSFSAKALFDYNLFDRVWFRGMSGLEGFSASGDNKCGDSTTEACNAEINYLSFDLWGRYLFSEGTIRPWAGAGFSLLFPMTKKATALDEASIINTSVMAFGFGADWFINSSLYIPISVEYGILPESDDVSASLIAIRAGFAVPF